MKYLLDEMLSPVLAKELSASGRDITHIGYRDRDGAPDHEVWRYALEQERIVITMNTSDFLTLAGRSEIHAGLIVLRRGGLTRQEQREWIQPILDAIEVDSCDMVNRVAEVTGVGAFTIRNLPEP